MKEMENGVLDPQVDQDELKKACKPLPMFESLTVANEPTTGHTIRVWRKELELPQFTDPELLTVLHTMEGENSMQDVIQTLGKLDRISKIELLGPDGDGVVVRF